MRNVWNARSRSAVPESTPVISAAVLRPMPGHLLDAKSTFRPLPGQSVFVHDLTLDAVGFRSRSPLDICSRYQVRCEDRSLLLRDSQVRVISCRRAEDGMYEIGTRICR